MHTVQPGVKRAGWPKLKNWGYWCETEERISQSETWCSCIYREEF